MRLLILPLLLVVALSRAGAQDVSRLGLELGLSEVRRVGGETVLLVTDGAKITGPGFTLQGEEIVLWCDPVIERLDPVFSLGRSPGEGEDEEDLPEPKTVDDWLGPIIHGAYVSGGVRYERVTGEVISVEAERLFVDFRLHRALILKAKVRGVVGVDARGRDIPIFFRADEIRQTAKGKLSSSRATVTTCEYEEPDYKIEVTDLEAGWTGDSWAFSGDGATFRIGAIPVFWLPYLALRQDFSLRPLRSVRIGGRSRFGTEIETLWGDEIHVGEGDARRRWGEWNVHLDERTRRGPGVGLDLEYGTDLYEGILRTYYQYDEGTRDRTTGDSVPRYNRGRAWWQHRYFLEEETRLDLETYLLSDGAYRKEFFEKESREDKNAETVAQLRHLVDNLAVFALVRYRGNDFETQTEYLPRVWAALISQPIADVLPGVQLLLDGEATLDQVRRRYARDLDERGAPEVGRANLRLALRSPFDVGPVRISPVLAGSGTAFTETVDRGSDGRLAAEGGVRADIAFHRQFPDVESDLLDLHGLRHVIHVDVEYLNRWTVTVDPDELIYHDELDELDETQVVTLRVRNRLLTRRGPKRKVIQALNLELEADYYPNRQRARNRSVHGLAFFETRLEAQLRDDLTLWMDLDYDMKRGQMLTGTTEIRYRPGDTWSVAVGQRFIHREQNLLTTRLDLRPVERYGFRGYIRYDLRDDHINRAGILVRRFGHDWVLETDLRVDDGLDEFAFTVSILPRGFEGGPKAGSEAADDRILYEDGP